MKYISFTDEPAIAPDEFFMKEALKEAQKALELDEVPIGAVIVHNARIIGRGHNLTETLNDVTAHAEMQALRTAAKATGNYRLADCTLFVTLEPCAMCSGAVLNARLNRVVFGAAEPKTGAAGSVVNLFADLQLNHQTSCQGGLLAAESALLLQIFFKNRRALHAQRQNRLRDDALRTPEAAFALLPGAEKWSRYSQWTSQLPSTPGLRLHYLDGQADAQLSGLGAFSSRVLCLHGASSWSYDYAETITSLHQLGIAAIAPDLFGFGQSDKPKKRNFHFSLQHHRQSLLELVDMLPARPTLLLVDHSVLPLALALLNTKPRRFSGLVMGSELLPHPGLADRQRLYQNAPFPDAGHRAGAESFARMLQSLSAATQSNES